MFLYDWSGYLDGWYAGGVLAVMAADVEQARQLAWQKVYDSERDSYDACLLNGRHTADVIHGFAKDFADRVHAQAITNEPTVHEVPAAIYQREVN